MTGRRQTTELGSKDTKNGLKKLLEDTLARATKDRDEQLLLHTTGDILYDLLRSFFNRTKASGFGFSFFDTIETGLRSEASNERKVLALFKLFDELEARAQLDLYELGSERAAAIILRELQRQLSQAVKAKKLVLLPSLRALALQKVYQFKVNEHRLELPSGDAHKSCIGLGLEKLFCWSGPTVQSWETVFDSICKSKNFRIVAKEILAKEYPVERASLRELQHAVEHVLKASVETPVLSRRPFVASTPSPLRHNVEASSAFASQEPTLRYDVHTTRGSDSTTFQTEFAWNHNRSSPLAHHSPYGSYYENEDNDCAVRGHQGHSVSYSTVEIDDDTSAVSHDSSSQDDRELATARTNLTYDDYAGEYSKSRHESLETLPSLRLDDMTLTNPDADPDTSDGCGTPDSLVIHETDPNSWDQVDATQGTTRQTSELSFWPNHHTPNLSFDSMYDDAEEAEETELDTYIEADDDDDDEEYDEILLERLNSALAMYCLKKNRPLRHSFLNTISEDESHTS